MKRCVQVIALCMAVLLAAHMMAQDAGGGGGGGGGDASGGGASGDSGAGSGGGGDTGGAGSSTSGGTSGGGANGQGGTGGGTMPSGGAGEGGAGGNGSAPTGGFDLFGPNSGSGTGTEGNNGTGTESNGPDSVIVPPLPPAGLPPGSIAPQPGTTPAPTPGGLGTVLGGSQGAVKAPPVTLTLPGGYGGSSSKSFTLGEGRLAKPPITFTLTISQGYDDNIFSADSTQTPGAVVAQPTPPLLERIIGYRILPPSPPTPIIQKYRPAASPTPAIPAPLGVIASPVSTATVAVQVQGGTARTILTADASAGAMDYLNRPGSSTTDYNFNFDMSFIHRVTSRMTVSLDMFAVYQSTPNFALLNAPTNNGNGGDYLNGSAKLDLTYEWTRRISTVTSLSLSANLLETNANNDLYNYTFGNQVRYMVSARNTVTAELRETEGTYPSDAAADTSSTYYLLGLDSILSQRLRNTFSFGIEDHSFNSGGGSKTLPYFESATTLSLPRGAVLQWTNRYGSEDTGSQTQTTTSYRTGLTLSQPLSTKLVASLSLAYNYLTSKDSAVATNSYKQTQLQTSVNLSYTVSPRFSMNLSYTYLDLMSGQVNASYTRGQVFFGGTYQFR
jgi:hypothetical protein